jgi:hypothetical protein
MHRDTQDDVVYFGYFSNVFWAPSSVIFYSPTPTPPTTSECNMPRGKKASANGKPTSKMDSVRQAMAALGNDAKPLEIQAHLKKLGVSLDTSLISNYKGYLQKHAGKKGKRRGRKAAKTATAGGSAGGISMAEIAAVKALTDRIGAAKVADLAKVLGK